MNTIIEYRLNDDTDHLLYDMGWRKCGMGGVLWTTPTSITTYRSTKDAIEDVFRQMGIYDDYIESESPLVDWVAKARNLFEMSMTPSQIGTNALLEILELCGRKHSRKSAISKRVKQALSDIKASYKTDDTENKDAT